jgi:hypothetical protein
MMDVVDFDVDVVQGSVVVGHQLVYVCNPAAWKNKNLGGAAPLYVRKEM